MAIRENKLWSKLISIKKKELNKLGCCVWFVEKVPIKGADGLCDENRIIYIDKNCSLFQQFSIIIHEGQHFKCLKNKCFCWKNKSDFWGEYHAFKTEYMECLDLLSVTKTLIEINKNIKHFYHNKWIVHLRALRKVVKLKAFKEAARSNFETRRYNSILKRLNNYIEKLENDYGKRKKYQTS